MDSESATIPGTTDQHGGRSITHGLARHFRSSHLPIYLLINSDGGKRVALTATLCEVVKCFKCRNTSNIHIHTLCLWACCWYFDQGSLSIQRRDTYFVVGQFEQIQVHDTQIFMCRALHHTTHNILHSQEPKDTDDIPGCACLLCRTLQKKQAHKYVVSVWIDFCYHYAKRIGKTTSYCSVHKSYTQGTQIQMDMGYSSLRWYGFVYIAISEQDRLMRVEHTTNN